MESLRGEVESTSRKERDQRLHTFDKKEDKRWSCGGHQFYSNKHSGPHTHTHTFVMSYDCKSSSRKRFFLW